MQIRVLHRVELDQALPMQRAIECMRDAFIALAENRADAPQRTALTSREPAGTTLLMGAAIEGVGLASKTVSVFDDNAGRGRPVVNGLMLALNPETGEPLGICDGGALTAIRTGAVVGAVTDVLANPESRIGALIGCGAQARTQLQAMDQVRSLDVIRVCGLERRQVIRFVADMQTRSQAELVACLSTEEAIDDADIVTAATNSRTPVLSGQGLKPGVHVNGVGSYTLGMRELDRDTLDGARIFVDEVDAALHEAGELVDAEQCGLTTRDDWIEIGRLFLDPELRPPPDRRTVFKSVGHPVQDVAAAGEAFATAERLRLGRMIEI